MKYLVAPRRTQENLREMDAVWTMMVALSAITNASVEGSYANLYITTPKIIFERMIEEAFDEELKNLTAGRTPRSFINDVDMEECTDNIGSKHCEYLRSYGSCFRMDMWANMKSMCRRTCKFCKTNPYATRHYSCLTSKFGCCPGTDTAASGPNKEGCEDLCYDLYGRGFCKTAKKLGMCKFDKKRTLEGCLKTCGHCRPCKDIVPLKCKIAAKLNACHQLRRSTINYCRKTCNFCGKRDPCYRFPCKNNGQCVVGSNGRPYCLCKRKCSVGDEYTGVVCGRDGNDYKNLCELRQAKCKTGSHVFVKRFGSCKEKRTLLSSDDCKRIKDIKSCKILVRALACTRFEDRMTSICPHACGFCAAKYQNPKPKCFYTKHGCCLDGVSHCRGPGYEGCPPCQDRLIYLCRRFVAACGEERNMAFMKSQCASTCRYCRSPNWQTR